MKALIVSDALQESQHLQSALEQAGYDTITYRWLLKALDNVEEVQPQLVVVNAVDYPRHWKVLVQHIKCSLKKQPQVVLLVPAEFDEDEAEKARLLGIRGCITGTGKKHQERLLQLISEPGGFSAETETESSHAESAESADSDSVVDATASTATETSNSNTVAKIIFIHPEDGTLYSGRITEKDDNQYHLITDRQLELKSGDHISDGSIKTAVGIRSIQAEVLETEPELILSVS